MFKPAKAEVAIVPLGEKNADQSLEQHQQHHHRRCLIDVVGWSNEINIKYAPQRNRVELARGHLCWSAWANHVPPTGLELALAIWNTIFSSFCAIINQYCCCKSQLSWSSIPDQNNLLQSCQPQKVTFSLLDYVYKRIIHVLSGHYQWWERENEANNEKYHLFGWINPNPQRNKGNGVT